MNNIAHYVLIYSIYVLAAITGPACAANGVYIVIHGTWATSASWAKKGGDFFDALERTITDEFNLVSFTWTGSNNHAARLQAAHDLVQLITSYPPNFTIHLVAHSHGANVGILASQLLGKQSKAYTIETFFALGTPVCPDNYLPDMNVIRYFYSLFSLSDHIQTVNNLFQREYPLHERIFNIRLFLDDTEPSHSTLHTPLIGGWIPMLHEFLWEKQAFFERGTPGALYLFSDTVPEYHDDSQRYEVIRQEEEMSTFLFALE